MMGFLRRFRPDHMTGQIALLVLAGILVFHFSVVATNSLTDTERHRPVVAAADVIAGAAVAVDAAAPGQRQEVLAQLARTAPWATLNIRPAPPSGWTNDELSQEGLEIASRLGRDADVREPPGSREHGGLFAIALKNGDRLLVSAPEPRRGAHARSGDHGGGFTTRLWERFATLFIICVLILSAWLSAKVVSPLVRLAEQAEKFPENLDADARAPETGPHEVVELSRAINRMQDRIRSMMTSRSHALAAISHDLRTIITRMRLRTEFIEDEGLKQKMLKDLQSVDGMLQKNLAFLRDGDAPPECVPVDIDSLLQTLADEFSEAGKEVAFSFGPHRAVFGSFSELQRLFSNLIENACRYGEGVKLSIREIPDALEIDVSDQGPGIAPQDRTRVLEPFVRGDVARTVNENAGFGLGLSIADFLAKRANGALTLLDNNPRGLIVRVRLPRARPANDDLAGQTI